MFAFLQGWIRRWQVTCQCGNNQNCICDAKRLRAFLSRFQRDISFSLLYTFCVGKVVRKVVCVFSFNPFEPFKKNLLHPFLFVSNFESQCCVSQHWLSSFLSCHNCPVDPIKSHLLSKHDRGEKKKRKEKLHIQYSISG